ncbi:sialate O-acetylesterase [Mobilitalea sibirica]|uniref:Sialate O-acetylesterase n=1 Tax=Mobilitalea sibirica TaxID=1462919 RepID=A0A8J7H0U3_9FIRM|nr:sialate O-acetylesterase [Mobilitalea sibirica]MBH1939540.1 sialate O-acetylesterase [Mobilitalea sibirica]
MEKQRKGIALSPLISDGMVLQRHSPVRIWGTVAPFGKVNVTFLGKEYQAEANKSGKWEILLENLNPGGPHEMRIESADTVKMIKDILIGDVWVLGGQSNMQIPVSRTLDLFEDEVSGAECSQIRKFSVPQMYDFHGPVDELCDGNWVSVTPETVYDFSAIGYFFAQNIYDTYKVPIGLIHTAIGGTPAEAWISEPTLLKFDRFKELLTLCKDDNYVNGVKQKEETRNNTWYHELFETDPGLNGDTLWYKEEFNDTDWKDIDIPTSFRGTELETHRGSVWFRKEFYASEDMVGENAKLYLGTIIDGDDTYLNGEKVGSTGYQYPPRRYKLSEGILKPGKNVLTVRVILTENVGAFITDMPYKLKTDRGEISLSGPWRYKLGAVMRALPPTTFFQYMPSGVYNNMIYPLRKYSIQGVLWYQGESNTGNPEDYKELFEAVIKDWRANWGLGDIPFLYVQLANFCPWKQEPEVSGWAILRDKQRRALALPGTGMAVTIDVGQYNDLHPWNKKTVAERLAFWARNMIFNENLECSGPLYDHMESEGDQLRIYFTHIGSGLIAKGSDDKSVKTFSICGPDGNYVEANAIIEGDTVLVSSNEIIAPVGIRYAWADNPEGANLYNKEGFPASPFSAHIES